MAAVPMAAHHMAFLADSDCCPKVYFILVFLHHPIACTRPPKLPLNGTFGLAPPGFPFIPCFPIINLQNVIPIDFVNPIKNFGDKVITPLSPEWKGGNQNVDVDLMESSM